MIYPSYFTLLSSKRQVISVILKTLFVFRDIGLASEVEDLVEDCNAQVMAYFWASTHNFINERKKKKS